jgi:cell division transport system ATP-binding protein
MRIVRSSARQIRRQVPMLLSLVGLSDKANNYPHELSGGEQQRVAMARALANNPLVLIADEPTGNLDPKNSLEVMQILEQVNQRGITILVSTHDQAMVNYFRKRVITLDHGQVVRDIQAGTYD